MQPKTNIIYNNLPEFKEKEIIYHLSNVCQIKHAPEDASPKNINEFLKVCKTYYEININTKTRRMSGFVHHFYRCLFSDQKQATKYQEKISKKWEEYKKQQAIKAFEKSKYKEEMMKTIEGDI